MRAAFAIVGTPLSGLALIDICQRYQQIRAHSQALIEPLSAEDCNVQSMPDASPAKWHLAHTSWFFESLILEPRVKGYQVFHPQYAFLFNSYYNALGDRHQRPQRGLLTRPSLDEVLAYRAAIDAAMLSALPSADADMLRLTEIGLNHEQQHQELLLSDIKHALSLNPLQPAYRPPEPVAKAAQSEAQWLDLPAGLYQIGHEGEGFAYDNESPRHQQWLAGAQLSSRLVSNDEYLGFIEAGGYQDPAWWLSDGWDWLQREQIRAPLYWQLDDASEFTLYGQRPRDPQAPVCHLSFYEADAYARYAGARLPSEAEWEVVCREQPQDTPQDTLQPTGHAWLGAVWQWTASPYQAYPGYKPPAGPLGEYNAKFMCNQLVLRGASALTPTGHSRNSYRNFFPAEARWQMTGLRLARDLA